MEIVIDEHAVRMLRQGNLQESDVRLIVATLKINNDLERMGDLAVNVSERAVSLAGMGAVQAPPELEPMTTAVRAMVSKCLGALIYQNVELATQVLESDDIVDQHRDQVFETLLAGMTENPAQAAPNLQFVLASRSLERIADHTTNIAEDVLFWVRGLEVRHGRAKQMEQQKRKPDCRKRPGLDRVAKSRSFHIAVIVQFNRHAYSQAAWKCATAYRPMNSLKSCADAAAVGPGGSRESPFRPAAGPQVPYLQTVMPEVALPRTTNGRRSSHSPEDAPPPITGEPVLLLSRILGDVTRL